MDYVDNYLKVYKQIKGSSEQEFEEYIEKELVKLPFQIEVSSLKTKRLIFERIMLLLGSEFGKNLLKEIKKIEKVKGKITIKESVHNIASGFVNEKNPLVIYLNPEEEKDLKYETTLASTKDKDARIQAFVNDAWEQNNSASTLGHELQHIIQRNHPDCNIHTSLENVAKKNLLIELGGKLNNIFYDAEVDLGYPAAQLYKDFLQHQKSEGITDEEAQKKSRMMLAKIYLTEPEDILSKHPKLKEEVLEWNKGYKRRSFLKGVKAVYSSDPEAIAREQNYLNFLCDSMGLDRNLLEILGEVLDKNRDGEKYKVDNIVIEQKFRNSQSVINLRAEYSESADECTYIDGAISEKTIYENNGETVHTTYYPDEKIKSEKIIDEKHGYKKTEFDEMGRKIKESQEWDGDVSKTVYDPQSENIIMSKRIVSEKTLVDRLSQGAKKSYPSSRGKDFP